MLTRLRSDVEGANAVEFALVLPILIVLILGILWGGIAISQKLAITQAAREGARFAATYPFTGDVPPSSWFADVATRVTESGSGQLDAQSGAFCIRFVNPTTSPAKTDFAFYPNPTNPARTELEERNPECAVEVAGDAANRVRVEVITMRPVRLDFGLYDFNVFTSADSVARFEPRLTND